MKHPKSTVFYLGLILAMSLTLPAFMCSGSDLHKANRAAKQVADDLHEFEAIVEQQYSVGQLDKEEARALAQWASDSSLANDAFVAKIKGLSTLNSSNSALVVGWFNDLVGQIDKLNDQGVLHIKSATAKAKFDLIYQSIQTGLTTLQGLLAGLGAQPSHSGLPDPALPVQRAGLDAAGIATLLMAFNGIAKLILQARSDGSLTDEQLQQGALDEDADTRNHAAAFIAQLEQGSNPPPK
jgi:hypothetical protein